MTIDITAATFLAQVSPIEHGQKVTTFLFWILPIGLFVLGMLLLGLWLAHWIWAKYAERVRLGYAQSGKLSGRLNALVDDQNDLLNNIHSRFDAERKDWRLKLGERDDKISGLAGKLTDANDSINKLKIDLSDKAAKIGDLNIGMTNLRNEKDDEIEKLRAKLKKQEELLARIKELEATLKKRDTEIISLKKNHDEEVIKLKQGYETEIIELKEKLRRVGELELKISNLEKRIVELQEIIAKREAEIEELRRRLQEKGDLEIKLGDMQANLGNREGEIEGLRLDLQNKGDLERKLLELEGFVRDRDTNIERLNAEVSHKDELEARIRELESLLGERNGELEKLRFDIATKGDLEGRIIDLEEQLSGRTNELDGLRVELSNKGDLEGRLAYFETQVQNKDDEISGLRSDLSAKVDLEARIGELEGQLSARHVEIRTLRADLDAKGDLNRRIGELEATLEVRNGEIERLRSRAADYAGLDELRLTLGSRTEERDRLNVEVKSLRDQLAGYSDFDKLKANLSTRDEQLKALKVELDGFRKRQNDLDGYDKLQVVVKEKDASLTDLRAQLKDARSTASRWEKQVKKLEKGAFDGEDVQEDEKLGIVYKKRPSKVDDLKLISGVASVLEKKLHQFGVYRFKQIATWRQLQIDEFSERLSFKDRIDRDLWVNQAADLHREKYGEHLTPVVDIYRKPERKVAKKKPAEKKDPTLEAFKGEAVKIDEKLGVIYTKRPAKVDDLKLISGVATVLEKKLHEFGVYRFKQIGMWNKEQIDEFSERLAFKDRVERDMWVHQAIDLHREKYGEYVAPRVPLFVKD